MIHHFSFSDLCHIQCLIATKSFTITVHRDLSRGVKSGVVNFQLVNFRGNYLIERTYVPYHCWKKARKRYVSLDAFLSECRSFEVTNSFIDDLPF